MREHPLEQGGAVVEALAVREDAPQAHRSAARHLGQAFAGGPVAVAHQREVCRNLCNRQAIGLHIGQRIVHQQHEARKVQALEIAKWE
jgi:hypothetical protein